MAVQAVNWIAAITGEEKPGSYDAKDIQEWLKNGVILCKLINALNPGAVSKVNESKMAFKMVSNA